MRHALLVAIVLATGCEPLTGEGRSCEAIEQSFSLDGEQAPPMRLRVESCRVDVDACRELCQSVLEEKTEVFAVVKSCDVEFAGEEVRLAIQYSTCPPEPIAEPGDGVPGI